MAMLNNQMVNLGGSCKNGKKVAQLMGVYLRSRLRRAHHAAVELPIHLETWPSPPFLGCENGGMT